MENKEAIELLKSNHRRDFICSECQNDDDECKSSCEFGKALNEAIKALENQPRWIPVTERLPDEMGSYITTIDCGIYGFATGQRFFFNDEFGWNDKDVIAWMPLPEPYTKEETT